MEQEGSATFVPRRRRRRRSVSNQRRESLSPPPSHNGAESEVVLPHILPPDQVTTRKTTTTPNRKHATTMDCNGVPFVIDIDEKFIADPEQDDITTMTTPGKEVTVRRTKTHKNSGAAAAEADAAPATKTPPPSLKTTTTSREDAPDDEEDEDEEDDDDVSTTSTVVTEPSHQKKTTMTTMTPASKLQKTRTTTAQEQPNPHDDDDDRILVDDADMIVYGTVNTELQDALAAGIERAIVEGVEQLPLLNNNSYRKRKSLVVPPLHNATTETSLLVPFDEQPKETRKEEEEEEETKTPKQRLIETLRYKFIRNVDVLEAYCACHVLTVQHHPPGRRKRIVQVMQQGLESLAPPILPTTTTTTTSSETVIPQNQSELPSEEDVQCVKDEVEQLQVKLATARRERNELLALEESTNRAEQLMDTVKASTTFQEEFSNETKMAEIKQDISKMVTDGNTMAHFNEEAKGMMTKLETIEQIKDDKKKNGKDTTNDDMEEEFDFDFEKQQDTMMLDPLGPAVITRTRSTQPLLSMQELYDQDRKQLGLFQDSTNAALHAMKDRLFAQTKATTRKKQKLATTPLRNATQEHEGGGMMMMESSSTPLSTSLKY